MMKLGEIMNDTLTYKERKKTMANTTAQTNRIEIVNFGNEPVDILGSLLTCQFLPQITQPSPYGGLFGGEADGISLSEPVSHINADSFLWEVSLNYGLLMRASNGRFTYDPADAPLVSGFLDGIEFKNFRLVVTEGGGRLNDVIKAQALIQSTWAYEPPLLPKATVSLSEVNRNG